MILLRKCFNDSRGGKKGILRRIKDTFVDAFSSNKPHKEKIKETEGKLSENRKNVDGLTARSIHLAGEIDRLGMKEGATNSLLDDDLRRLNNLKSSIGVKQSTRRTYKGLIDLGETIRGAAHTGKEVLDNFDNTEPPTTPTPSTVGKEDTYRTKKNIRGHDRVSKDIESMKKEYKDLVDELSKTYGVKKGAGFSKAILKKKLEKINEQREALRGESSKVEGEIEAARNLGKSYEDEIKGSYSRIRDIRNARRNLAIAGAVGLGAAGLGYGIYKWRKNRKKKREEEEKNTRPKV